jgi:hypothetical protein
MVHLTRSTHASQLRAAAEAELVTTHCNALLVGVVQLHERCYLSFMIPYRNLVFHLVIYANWSFFLKLYSLWSASQEMDSGFGCMLR